MISFILLYSGRISSDKTRVNNSGDKYQSMHDVYQPNTQSRCSENTSQKSMEGENSLLSNAAFDISN